MFVHRQFDFFVACLLGLIVLAAPLQSDSIALKPAADTTLFETTPDGNLGESSMLWPEPPRKGKGAGRCCGSISQKFPPVDRYTCSTDATSWSTFRWEAE